MQLRHSRSLSVLSTALLTTWALAASAQQAPGTNVPTPDPVPSDQPAVATAVTPVLTEPVIDPSTRASTLPNKPLLVTGVVLLGGAYGASAIAGRVSDRSSDEKLYYPVVGPWMALNDRDCDATPCSRKTLGTTLLVGSGVVQGLGALSMVLSLMIPEKTTHTWYLIGNEHQEHLLVAPVAGSDQIGALAIGRF